MHNSLFFVNVYCKQSRMKSFDCNIKIKCIIPCNAYCPFAVLWSCHFHTLKGKPCRVWGWWGKIISWFNPILTGGGGGGSIWPPCTKSDCLATAADRDAPFHDFLLSSLMHLLIPSLQKSDLRLRGHMTFCTRTSAQNLPKICILHMVYKTHGNYWLS